jgi:hypothetical protein
MANGANEYIQNNKIHLPEPARRSPGHFHRGSFSLGDVGKLSG